MTSVLTALYHFPEPFRSSLSVASMVVLGLALIIVFALYISGLGHRETAISKDPFPSWDSKNPWESLKVVFTATETQGESAIQWYRYNVKSKRFGSRFIRLFAISLASIGALIPLLNPPLVPAQDAPQAQWGYFSFAAVLVLLGIDKFYGFSTGWVRYLKTQMDLERGLSDLRYDWTALVAKAQAPAAAPAEHPTVPAQQPAAPAQPPADPAQPAAPQGQSPSSDQIQVMLQKLKDFVDFVHAQIQQETEAWVVEFQASLSDLMTSVKAQADTSKPGSLQVTVKNSDKFDSVTVSLDQLTEMPVQGGQCFFPSVAVGPHAISARAKKADKETIVSDVVKVSPGGTATGNLNLPG